MNRRKSNRAARHQSLVSSELGNRSAQPVSVPNTTELSQCSETLSNTSSEFEFGKNTRESQEDKKAVQGLSESNKTEVMRKPEIAIKELEILQAVIARQDEFKEKAKTLAVTLLSAVSIGYFSGQLTLSNKHYLVASFGVCLAFMILEGLYGTTEVKAEGRVEEIEEYLKGEKRNSDFSTPQITGPLLKKVTWFDFYEGVSRSRTQFFYLSLLLLVFLGALFTKPTVSPSEEDQQLLQQLPQLRYELLSLKNESDKKLSQLGDRFEARLKEVQESLKLDFCDAMKKLNQSTPKQQ